MSKECKGADHTEILITGSMLATAGLKVHDQTNTSGELYQLISN